MKHLLIFGLAALMFTGTMVGTSGCRSSTRTVTLWPGDRNVTAVKKPKRRKIKGRKKVIRSTSYNRSR